MKRAFPLVLCCAPALGFTHCEDFATVPVPVGDPSAPSVGTETWIDGVVYQEAETALLVDHLSDTFTVLPFVYDQGGAYALFLTERVTFSCFDQVGNPVFQQRSLTTQYEEQSGSNGLPPPPGTPISNGIWFMGQVDSLQDWAWLCPGMYIDYAVYDWWAQGWDTKYNQGVTSGQISYLGFL
jgi:hypothetical protein